ncbi:MAG: virulence factor family protein [Acidobacteria bacterium]|nr:virulence factor family protein [Acidobacteriota bacterium]
MKRIIPLVLVVALLATNTIRGTAEESLRFGRFGAVTLYRESPHPSHVILFVSGDGGWNQGVVDMAKSLASLDALVVGIDTTHYLKELAASNERRSYPAADFEALSKYVQKKLDFPRYATPVLIGCSSGATLVYATLVQAPPTTFLGAISLGFCPDLLLKKPLCRGSGLEWRPGPKGKGFSFLPAKALEAPWIAFQGTIDQVCDAAAVQSYVKRVRQGELILLPKVGHGFSVPKNWMPQLKQAFLHLVERHEPARPPQPPEVEDLPLEIVPAQGPESDTLAVIVTGDGGWGVTDRGLSNALASHGIPVVGLNSLHYFWTRRTPEQAARDLERILRRYLDAWKKEKVILIGYSFGADVLPFMANRLPEDLFARVRLVALLGPSQTADFEFHLTDWLGGSRSTDYPVIPEVEKLKGVRLFCFYGEDDEDAICKDLDSKRVKIIPLEGGHRIGRDYEPLAEAILKEVG